MRRVAICAVILALAVGVRYAFPDLHREIYDSLFGSADFGAAFSSIGAALNGEVPFGEGMKAAFGYAFGSGPKKTDVSVDAPAEDESETVAVFAPQSLEKAPPGDASFEKAELRAGTVCLPMAGEVVSGFGYREENGKQVFHYGVDIAAPEGTEVAAFSGGTVTVAGESPSFGRYVVISDGVIETRYHHLSRVSVTGGQTVTAGQTIGLCGSTGDTDVSMLYFSISQEGVYLNPRHYLSW